MILPNFQHTESLLHLHRQKKWSEKTHERKEKNDFMEMDKNIAIDIWLYQFILLDYRKLENDIALPPFYSVSSRIHIPFQILIRSFETLDRWTRWFNFQHISFMYAVKAFSH